MQILRGMFSITRVQVNRVSVHWEAYVNVGYDQYVDGDKFCVVYTDRVNTPGTTVYGSLDGSGGL